MTDAELAILSILTEGAIRGTEIQTLIVRRGLRSWANIGVSSLYYVLEKLARQGLVEGTSARPTDGPSRRDYRITAAGVGVLQTAVADLLSTPRQGPTSFELGLANMHVLRPSQIRNALMAYRQELLTRLAQARERHEKLVDRQALFPVEAMFQHQVAVTEAELAWLDTFVSAWEAQAPAEEAMSVTPAPDIPRAKQVVLPHDPDSPHRLPTQVGSPPAPERDGDVPLDLTGKPSSSAATRPQAPRPQEDSPPNIENPPKTEADLPELDP